MTHTPHTNPTWLQSLTSTTDCVSHDTPQKNDDGVFTVYGTAAGCIAAKRIGPLGETGQYALLLDKVMGTPWVSASPHIVSKGSDQISTFFLTESLGRVQVEGNLSLHSVIEIDDTVEDRYAKFKSRMVSLKAKHNVKKYDDMAQFLLSNPKTRLKGMRVMKGLTQAELAKAADVTQAIVSNLETGKGERGPDVTTLSRIQDVLEVDFGDFWKAVRCARP